MMMEVGKHLIPPWRSRRPRSNPQASLASQKGAPLCQAYMICFRRTSDCWQYLWLLYNAVLLQALKLEEVGGWKTHQHPYYCFRHARRDGATKPPSCKANRTEMRSIRAGKTQSNCNKSTRVPEAGYMLRR